MNKKIFSNFCCFILGTLLISNNMTVNAQRIDSLSIEKNRTDTSLNIMNYFDLIQVSWIKVSESYVPKNSTGSSRWIFHSENFVLFDSIQQLLFGIPAEGDVWKEFDCSEITSLELMDNFLKKRTLYFDCGALNAPSNSAYHLAPTSQKVSELFRLVQSLPNSIGDTTKTDTINVIFGDSLYYKEITFHLICADGSPGIDETRKVFKETNKDAYYIIHPGYVDAVEFEGRIKPGNKYHGNCKRYYSQTHIASETSYFDGIKHGREVHYERSGEINWEKQWLMGKHIPNIKN